jgi:hypothetical protein
MRRLSLLCLALLLSGCVASLAEIRQAPPDQVGNFPATAPALSYCVLRGIEAIDSSYEAHLSGGPVDIRASDLECVFGEAWRPWISSGYS